MDVEAVLIGLDAQIVASVPQWPDAVARGEIGVKDVAHDTWVVCTIVV